MGENTPLEMVLEARLSTGLGGRWYGVYPALVSDITDPDGQGRVKVTLPWSPDTGGGRYEAWARVATLMGGPNRGSWFIPDVHDEVLIVFEGGDPRRPYVIGGLWNGRDSPPESMDGAGKNFLHGIADANRFRNPCGREVDRILASRNHRLDQIWLISPQPDFLFGASHRDGQCGAPAARSDNCDRGQFPSS